MSFLLKNSILFASCVCIIHISAFCQSESKSFSILFYNVENLFDTINNPHTKDDEFTPEGDKQWGTRKYYRKLHSLSQVIIASGGWDIPDIIGLAEIETKKCTQDLIYKTALSRFRYEYIHHESPDFRGIDVALIYNPQSFTPLYDSAITVLFPNQNTATTRDILYVKGVITDWQDTLHIFVLHFPSRFGGTKRSEFKRIAATNTVLNTIEDIRKKQANAHIIIMGDFNDTPKNKAPQSISSPPYSFIRLTDSTQAGTYVYKGVWQELDHCYISCSIQEHFSTTFSIVSHNFMLQADKNGKTKPFRTYAGPYYLGGYSDHLPIMCVLRKKKEPKID